MGMTGYIKMIDIWMMFTISYPFVVITLHCLDKLTSERNEKNQCGKFRSREILKPTF